MSFQLHTAHTMDHRHVWSTFSAYNTWANQKLAELFSSLDEAAANKTIVSSFPSVKLTFLHIWDAELIWLKRLQGLNPEDFPSASFEGSFDDVLREMLNNSRDFQAFVAVQDETYFEKMIAFKNLAGKQFSQPAYEMIQHCLNHSTYHRGQLVTMARQLGLKDIPATDFVYFKRQG